jgi:hypothetical protein
MTLPLAILFIYLSIYLFWWNCSLNLGLWAYEAGAYRLSYTPLEPLEPEMGFF